MRRLLRAGRRQADAKRLLIELYLAPDEEKALVVERHPELLDDVTDDLLGQAIAAAFHGGDEQSVHQMEHDRLLLRRCREIGVEAAHAEADAGYSVPTPPALTAFLDDPSVAVFERALASGEVPSIDAAVARLERLLDHPAWPSAPPEFKALWLHTAGNLFHFRYKRAGDARDLDRAAEAFRGAVDALPAGWTDRAHDLNNLGNALLDRYDVGGDVADLDRAAEALQEGLACTRPGWSVRPLLLNGLANTLSSRFERTGEMTDLDRAIELREEAVAQTRDQPEELCLHLGNLGHDLQARYDRTGDRADLEHSIEFIEEALRLAPAGSPHRQSFLTNLAVSLRARYKRGGELHALERVIRLDEESLGLLPSGTPGRDTALGNVGIGLQDRYERTGNVRDLERAIAMYEDALEAAPASSPGRPRLLANLANGLETRYERSFRLDDLERALRARVEAVRGLPRGAPARASRLSSLGNTLELRYRRTAAPEDLDLAIDSFQQAVDETPRGSPDEAGNLNNLAAGLVLRHERDRRLSDLVAAANAYRSACAAGLGYQAEAALIAARNWSRWASRHKRWDFAAEAYGYALDAVDRLYRIQLGRPHKEAWLREAQGLPAGAAYALAELGQLERAVTVFEQGRALLLSETLERDQGMLERLVELGQGPLAERYRAAAGRLGGLERGGDAADAATTAPPPVSELRATRDELQAVIDEIRGVEGYERFFDPPNFADVAVAAATAPLAYLAATENGGLGLVVTPSASVARVPLPALTSSALRDHVVDYHRAYSGRRGDPDAWLATLDRVTRWLWDALMGPLLAAVSPATRVVLVPAGLLGMLPLHAAWEEDVRWPTGRRYALDDALLSYAPNARALTVASRRAAALGLHGVLAVEDPQWDTHPVPQADREIEAALAALPGPRRLRRGEATKAATLAALDGHAVLHFACHGLADLTEPLASALILAGGARLTLRELLERRIPGARLAVLSACETAVPGVDLPDEVVSLPTGLLTAGAAGVVGSLWSVTDVSTMLVMVRFYEELGTAGIEPAEALRRAQRWVRDTTNADKLARYPDMAVLAGADVPTRYRAFWEAAQAHDHPYHWAAFALVGT